MPVAMLSNHSIVPKMIPKVSSSRLQEVSWPIAASVARAAAQASIQSWQQIR